MQTIDLLASELLPHRAGMLFLDRALEGDDNCITACAQIKENHLFAQDGRVGSWVLLEYMAQTMAMWTSWNARKKGLPVPVGFLLGTRQLKLHVDSIPVGTELYCKAERIYVSETDGVAQFQCEVYADGQLLGVAALNAFEPKNPETFLAEH